MQDPKSLSTSNADGRFEAAGAPPGCDYGLFLNAGIMFEELRYATANAAGRSGETTDVGDVRFKKD